MRNIVSLLLLLVSVWFYAQKSFTVSGKLAGFEENALVTISKDNVPMDSCRLQNGRFQVKGKLLESPESLYLIIKEKNDYKRVMLFIGNENITINADKKDFPYDVRVQGSKFTGKSFELNQKIKNLMRERDELVKKMFELQQEGKWNDSLMYAFWSKKEPIGKITAIDNKTDSIENQYIEENLNTYYGVSLLETVKARYTKEQLKSFMKRLSPEMNRTRYAQSIRNDLEYDLLKIGDLFYDFEAETSKGKKVKFSDYFHRNKLVLLNFSTPYCGACLLSIPYLEKLKSEMSDLEIVTFYVDSGEKGLNTLKKKHSENWEFIWDRKGTLSETQAKYKVNGTPRFYIFDSEGKLLGKLDGFSETMNDEIKKILNKNNPNDEV